ncbi:DUF3304 domain-containing protein [Vulcaniibacterium tengchongense]|uniref:Uncharacterized protein DUF3304 n=1 Tax=Vulcaniibacterium tengchongense TaxID=1273429 RepID=A0A3N4V4W5_9GAMM|nr:DUF3304 domain-containing protein [Vulcaniibacterium tengchongense]RPE74791.1 uncharacterized protein DUF3304 [Vulcaniibacterium tengchongense]
MYLLAAVALTVLTAACQARPAADTEIPASASAPEGPFDLVINGYNYTDHYIDSFYVDGSWGGNLFVSTPTAGGGKSTCCVRWYSWMQVPKTFRVRWTADACLYEQEVEGQVFTQVKHLWKEQDVTLATPPPATPVAFEVHFYRDGRVEVAIADDIARPPRLKLEEEDGRRKGAPERARCTPEQMRTYSD